MALLLVKWSIDWADEFDVEGSSTITEKELTKLQRLAIEVDEHYGDGEYEASFGTNQALRFETCGAILDAMEIVRQLNSDEEELAKLCVSHSSYWPADTIYKVHTEMSREQGILFDVYYATKVGSTPPWVEGYHSLDDWVVHTNGGPKYPDRWTYKYSRERLEFVKQNKPLIPYEMNLASGRYIRMPWSDGEDVRSMEEAKERFRRVDTSEFDRLIKSWGFGKASLMRL